jgi:transposase
MARAYSQDLRDRVISAALNGAAVREVATRFGIAASTATRWVRRAKETGERKARRQGHGGCSKLDPHREFLLAVIAETPRVTLSALRERLRLERGLSVGAATIWAFLKRERPGAHTRNRTRNLLPRRCKTDDGQRSDNVGC